MGVGKGGGGGADRQTKKNPKQIDGHMDRRRTKQTVRQADLEIWRHGDRMTDKQTDRQADRQSGGQRKRQV